MLPILFQSNDLILYSYPLLMGLGWGIGYQIYFSNLDATFSRLKAQILFWGIFLSAWVGAKLLFYFTFPKDNQNILGQVSFWTGGGFVFYGGFIGAIVFLSFFKIFDKKFRTINLWPMLPALALGHAVGRIGCLLAGCCFGKPTEFFWGIYLHDHYRHPTQLIEAIGLFAIGIYLLKSKKDKVLLIGNYLLSYGILRLFVESLRGDIVRGEWGNLTPSQWISIALVISGIAVNSINKSKGLKSLN